MKHKQMLGSAAQQTFLKPLVPSVAVAAYPAAIDLSVRLQKHCLYMRQELDEVPFAVANPMTAKEEEHLLRAPEARWRFPQT